MNSTYFKKVYVFIPDYAKYDDAAIYLGEGLKELGVEVYSNRNYWHTDLCGNYLYQKSNTLTYEDCDVVVFTSTWVEYICPKTYNVKSSGFPDWIFKNNRNYNTVFIDNRDGYKTSSWDIDYRKFDLILRAKLNKKTTHPTNMKPWIHGFSSRMLKMISRNQKKTKERVILQNFGFTHSHLHSCRKRAIEVFLPKIQEHIPVLSKKSQGNIAGYSQFDRLMWEQTEGKHDPEYYNLISSNVANLCFCGELIPGLPLDPSNMLQGGKKAKIRKLFWKVLSISLSQQERIIQWDSWRFWETLVAGSVAIHIDLEKYGVDLPVMPVNGVHYLGIDFQNLSESTEFIISKIDKLSEIGESGKEWVMSNYHPRVSAKRFLAYIS